MPDVIAQTDTGPKLEMYAEIRHACAVNSAAMIPFIGAEEFVANMNTLRAVASDPHFVVRRAVAANLLDICCQLHPFGKAVHPILNQLLVDPYSDVICSLVPHIGAIIEHLTRLGPQSPFVEVFPFQFNTFSFIFQIHSSKVKTLSSLFRGFLCLVILAA